MKTKKKILVVDDEEIIRALMRRVLIKEGYEVLCASDGKTAIADIQSEKLDLVLLDLKMPGINGIETLEEIRKIDKNIPIVLVTAYSNDENSEKATELGILGYIRKLFELDEVRLKIRRALIKRNNQRKWNPFF